MFTQHGIGLIGFGIMGKRFATTVSMHPGFTVAAGWDPGEEARARFVAVCPMATLAQDAAAVVEHPATECIYIASPPASHSAYVALAVAAGKPVLCEKPLGIDISSSTALVRQIEARGAKAGVNFPFASAPAVAELGSALARGEIGAVTEVSIDVAFAAWPRDWQPAGAWLSQRLEGGFTREVLSHFVFLVRRLLGPLSVVSAQVSYPDDGMSAERALIAFLRAGTIDITVKGSVGTTDAAERNHCTFTGTRGALRLYDWANLAWLDGEIWRDHAFGEGPPLRLRAHLGQLEQVAAMIAGQGHTLATFQEALDVQVCIETMLQR